MNKPVICLFGNDLRLADHPALAAAVSSGTAVVPCYILDETAAPAAGAASHWWLHHSLAALARDIEARGNRLILRRGPRASALAALAMETGAGAVHFTRGYGAGPARAEQTLKDALSPNGITCYRHGGSLLFEPEKILTAAATPYRVFTPFYHACLAQEPPAAPVPAPMRISAPATFPNSEILADWHLTPVNPDWSTGLAATWTPGEAGAKARFGAFLDGPAADYASARDRPDLAGTSRLSAHLHFGEISPVALWHAARFAASHDDAAARGIEGFLRQLLWREFCHHLLHHVPHMTTAPFRPEFARFPWRTDDISLRRWQRGRTGYPIVDAGMRELWQTGWMHNRVRMIAASFLVKDLMIAWQDGAAWFNDTLVDADLANNIAGWQWVAGSGADAAPYFRIFNPVLQGRKFDPDGSYVRRWIPEIAALPDRYLQAPWEAPPAVVAAAGIALGENYPAPMVDHAEARSRALAAFRSISNPG